MEDLRRILAKRTYGTNTSLPPKDWERPFLQSYLDQTGVIDCCEDSENINLKEQFQRAKVFESIQKRTNEAPGKSDGGPSEIVHTSLRKKYAMNSKLKTESNA